MTDGIIQEVFKNWAIESHKRTHPFHECNFPIQTELKILQQELIEKIRQELDSHFDCLDYGCVLKEKLIGANQE